MTSKVIAALLLIAVVSLPVPAAAWAQTASGTISGRVVDAQGLAVPGVTVTVQSPNLQGSRAALTSPNGDYLLPLLPPGVYTITFELSEFAILREVRDVAATEPVTVDVTMEAAGVQEVVNVTGRTNMFVETVQSATNITATTLAVLPTTRTLAAAVDLAAGVHATGPGRQVTISGGLSFENVFLLNGVQITENIRNRPLPLFIEDAIQEVTTTTSGISAEYGRFTGGVVNAITKSGSNLFAASLRTTLSNDSWRSTSPFGEPKTDQVVPTYEFTAGGPIVRDRTWYFVAGRLFDNAVTKTLGITAVPYETRDDEKRFEAKLTQSLAAGQNVTVAYTKIERQITNEALPNPASIMDLKSLTDVLEPQDLLSVRHTGSLGQTLFLESQVLFRNLTSDRGGKSTDRTLGTLILDRARNNRLYGAPYQCSVCIDQQLDSSQVLVKGNYFLSTARGAHNPVFGYDTFNNNHLFDNHQSATDYLVDSTTSVVRDGLAYPVFNSDGTTFIRYQPILLPSQGWNFRTHALFFNDTWRYDNRFTFNLGVRWDKNHGTDSLGNLVASGSAVSPRLGVVWDLKGDGRWAVTAGFSKYVAAIAGPIGNAASPAGRPALFRWNYRGPTVNADPNGPLVPTDQALQILFNWFDSVGGTNLRPYAGSPNIPGFTTTINGSLGSPYVIEYAGGVSGRLGTRGALRADVIYRARRDFYANVTDMSTGRVTNSAGQTFDLTLIENTNAVNRPYAGLTIQSNYRPTDRLDIAGNYTLSRLWGTFDGEGVTPTLVRWYPEYNDVRWTNPEGDLPPDQRHRVRLWGTYQLPVTGGVGNFRVAAIERIETGTPHSAVGPIDSRPFVANPGYVNPTPNVGYFFAARDQFRMDTMVQTDLALNYNYKLARGGRAELFGQLQLLNAFNQFQLIDRDNIDHSVLTPANTTARYEAFNPFTTVPVRGVHWDYGPIFGQALGAGAYTVPRTFLVTFGIRY